MLCPESSGVASRLGSRLCVHRGEFGDGAFWAGWLRVLRQQRELRCSAAAHELEGMRTWSAEARGLAVPCSDTVNPCASANLQRGPGPVPLCWSGTVSSSCSRWVRADPCGLRYPLQKAIWASREAGEQHWEAPSATNTEPVAGSSVRSSGGPWGWALAVGVASSALVESPSKRTPAKKPRRPWTASAAMKWPRSSSPRSCREILPQLCSQVPADTKGKGHCINTTSPKAVALSVFKAGKHRVFRCEPRCLLQVPGVPPPAAPSCSRAHHRVTSFSSARSAGIWLLMAACAGSRGGENGARRAGYERGGGDAAGESWRSGPVAPRRWRHFRERSGVCN